jgi:hypothetical protein
MGAILAAILLLVMAIIIGGTMSFFGGSIAMIGAAIAFGLLCLGLIIGLIGVLITA